MHRNQFGRPWWLKASLFAAASAFAGGSAGWLLALVGSLLAADARSATAAALAVVGVAVGIAELLGRRVPVLQCGMETPQRWIHTGPLRWALRNGLSLGCGAMSRIGFWSWFLIPFSAFLVGDVVIGVLVYGVYGLARGACGGALTFVAKVGERRGLTSDDIAVALLGRVTLARRVSGALLLTASAGAVVAVGF